MYPSVSIGEAGEGAKKEGGSRRIESAFAHSPYPNTFAGWDKLKATSEAEQRSLEGLTGASSVVLTAFTHCRVQLHPLRTSLKQP